jgi:predicted lactoylglutathione lyase
MVLIANGRGVAVERSSISQLGAGTMVSTDLGAARHFYEDFLGFQCVRYAPDRMLIRDQHSRRAMLAGSSDFLVIDVREVPEITHPQHWLNHWGLTVPTTAEVDRIHEEAKRGQETFGIRHVRKITELHGAYGFYFADRDLNWWEIECRLHGMSNNDVFQRGDFNKKD